MPVFDESNYTVTKKDVTPKIVSKPIVTNVVDTQYTNRKSLITNISGSPWKVDWYSQILDKDDQVDGLQENRNAARQQYIEYKGVVMRVQSELSSMQNPDDKTLVLEGDATITNSFIPNPGDFFVADIGDGRRGIFDCLDSTRLSHLKDTAHDVNYRLRNYYDEGVNFQIDWKVVKTYYVYNDPMRYGYSDIIEEGEYNQLRDYEKKYRHMFEKYMNKFWSNEYHTLLVPGNPNLTTYDHFLTQFVLKLFNARNMPNYHRTQVLNVNEDYNVMTCDTVFDALMKRDSDILRTGVQKMSVALTRSFMFHPIFNSITYTGIKNVIYPSDGSKKIDYQVEGNRTKAWFEYSNSNESFRQDSIDDQFGEQVTLPGFQGSEFQNAIPVTKPVMSDDYYIFTEPFYKGGKGLSALEHQVRIVIEETPPDPKIIDSIIDQSRYWPVLEQFYYTPFLLMLIYVHTRNL